MLEVAKKLREFCDAHYDPNGKCDCPLAKGRYCLAAGSNPQCWSLPCQWTDEEIALAKAMKSFGGETIIKETDGALYVRDRTQYEIIALRCGAFTRLPTMKSVSIDKIIAEGDSV